MKCRNILAVAVAVAAMQSYGVSTTNEACRIAVTNATRNTVIGLAAVNFGLPASETMNATNYVLTANLADGVMLYQQSDSKLQGWVVSEGKWIKPNTITLGTNIWSNTPVDNLPYGDAVILVREPSNTPFYLVGQCPLTNMTCSVGPGERKMLANLSYSEVNMNELHWSVQPSSGDVIEVLKDSGTGFDSYFRYGEGASAAWGTNTYNSVSTPFGSYLQISGTNAVTDVTFPPGTGFWYKNNSSANTPTLQWTRSN